jgi:hypothetical protein
MTGGDANLTESEPRAFRCTVNQESRDDTNGGDGGDEIGFSETDSGAAMATGTSETTDDGVATETTDGNAAAATGTSETTDGKAAMATDPSETTTTDGKAEITTDTSDTTNGRAARAAHASETGKSKAAATAAEGPKVNSPVGLLTSGLSP